MKLLISEQLIDTTSQVICDSGPNITGSGNKIIVPTYPRKITQNQIYAANEILNNRKTTKQNINNAILDVIATIPYSINRINDIY